MTQQITGKDQRTGINPYDTEPAAHTRRQDTSNEPTYSGTVTERRDKPATPRARKGQRNNDAPVARPTGHSPSKYVPRGKPRIYDKQKPSGGAHDGDRRHCSKGRRSLRPGEGRGEGEKGGEEYTSGVDQQKKEEGEMIGEEGGGVEGR